MGWGLRLGAVAQGYSYSNMELVSYFQKSFEELESTIELGLGWLRAAAPGYSYSCSKIDSVSNFSKNLMSWGTTLGWGLDGCARRREVTITVAVNLICVVILKRI